MARMGELTELTSLNPAAYRHRPCLPALPRKFWSAASRATPPCRSSDPAPLPSRLATGVEAFFAPEAWFRRHLNEFVAFLFILGFCALPFYDLNNMALVIATVTHFTNGAPPSTLSLWAAGPFITSVYIPGYLGYVGSGFELYWTYTTLKLIFAGFTAALAFLLYSAAKERAPVYARQLAVFTLLNPALFFVSFVWANYDIIPVALLTAGYVVLRFPSVGPAESVNRLTLAGVLVCVSVFFYWFAIALIPTLIAYTEDRRERALLAIVLIVGVALLFAFDLTLLSGGLATYLSAAVGSVQTINSTQVLGLMYFAKLSGPVYLAFLLVLGIAVPILLRALKFTECQTSFLILTLLVLSTPFALPDNYVFAFPFAALAVLETGASKRSLWILAGLLAYAFAGIALFNLYIGNNQQDGVGIFYWGYDLLGTNVRFIQTYAQQLTFIQAYNVVLLATSVLSIGIVVLLRVSRGSGVPNATPPRNGPEGIHRPSSLARSSRRRLGSKLVILAAVGIVTALAFNSALPDLIQLDGGAHGLPIYAITPIFWPNNGNIPREIANDSYTILGDRIHIFRDAPPMAIGTWYSDQEVEMGGTIGLSGDLAPTTPVLNGTPFAVGVRNLTQPDESSGVRLPVSASQGVVNISLPYQLLNRTASGYQLDGNASLVYNLNDSTLLNRYFAFAFSIQRYAALQTSVFHLQNERNFVALVFYEYEVVLVYGGQVSNGSFVQEAEPLPLQLGAWNYVVIHATLGGFEASVDGIGLTITAPLFGAGPSQLRVGVPFLPGGQSGYSLDGDVTDIFSTESLPTLHSLLVATVGSDGTEANIPLDGMQFDFLVEGGPSSTTLAIQSATFRSGQGLGSIYLGKLQAGRYSINLTLTNYSVHQAPPGGYYLLPVYVSFVTPYLAIIYCCFTVLLRQRGGVKRR